MKIKKILLAMLTLSALSVSAQQTAPTAPTVMSDIEHVGASLESVQTLKALVVEQVEFYELSVQGPSVLDAGWEKRQVSGVYMPQTELGPNLKELSELVSSRPLQVAVSNPTDDLVAYVAYFPAPDLNGVRTPLFTGAQSFKLVAMKGGGYKFPEVRPRMRMVDLPETRFPGVQLSSVKVTERSPDEQIIDGPRYLEVNWKSGVAAVRIPAYLVEGERHGEIVFQYWQDNKLQARVFDLGTGKPIEPQVGTGSISPEIDGVIVVNDDDVVLTFPESGRIPLIQLIVPAKRDVRFGLRGIVNGNPESATGIRARQVGRGLDWGFAPLRSGEPEAMYGVDPGVYWIIPQFVKYGRDLPPEYYKPQPPQPVYGGGSVEKGL